MKPTRRQVLEYTSLILSTSLVVPFAQALNIQCDGDGASDDSNEGAEDKDKDIVAMLNIDPETLAYVTSGPCCWYCEDLWIVSHYQPVAFIEIFRDSADSLFAQADSEESSEFAVNVDKDSYVGSHVRIYELKDFHVDQAMAYQGCKLCGIEAARKEPPPSDEEKCVQTFHDDFMKDMMDQMNESLDLCWMPKLVYDTTMDFLWTMNYCDIIDAGSDGPYCDANNIFSFDIEDIKEPKCIGELGSIKPRQQANVDTDPRRSAARSAYRAIHLAREKEFFEFDADPIKGKLQLVSPHKKTGYAPGTEDHMDTLNDCEAQTKGLYGFVWWVPVGCCKERSDVMGFCEPETCDS